MMEIECVLNKILEELQVKNTHLENKFSTDIHILASQTSYLQEKIARSDANINDLNLIKMSQKNLEEQIEKNAQILSKHKEEISQIKADHRLMITSFTNIEKNISTSLQNITSQLDRIRSVADKAEKQNISQHSELDVVKRDIIETNKAYRVGIEDIAKRLDFYVKTFGTLLITFIGIVVSFFFNNLK